MTTGFPTPPAKGFLNRLLARTDEDAKWAISIMRKPLNDRTYEETMGLQIIIMQDRDQQKLKRKGKADAN